jgi:hypothetical protein
VLGTAQLQALEVEVAPDPGACQAHVGAHGAARVQRQTAGESAVLGAQARQQAARETHAAAHARAIQARRGIEHATIEPKRLGHRRIAQIDTPVDPGTDDLQSPRGEATLGIAARKVGDELCAHRVVGRWHQWAAQAHTRDVAVDKGAQQDLFGRPQRCESRQSEPAGLWRLGVIRFGAHVRCWSLWL